MLSAYPDIWNLINSKFESHECSHLTSTQLGSGTISSCPKGSFKTGESWMSSGVWLKGSNSVFFQKNMMSKNL